MLCLPLILEIDIGIKPIGTVFLLSHYSINGPTPLTMDELIDFLL